MFSVDSYLIFSIAFLIDLIIGDPTFLPHPVRWMGTAIITAEPHFRKLPFPLVISGLLFSVALILSTFGAAWFLVWIADAIHPLSGGLVRIILIYYCISARSLDHAAMKVYEPLINNDLDTARKNLSMIVGRETGRLDPEGISRAAVETVAENFVDGVVSPLFYAAIGGAPLAIAFKMINTLDSMVGYRNERYIEFGKASARIDDVFNLIPARLSIPIIALAAQLLAGKGRIAFRTAILDGSKHLSPNSGYPEAAFAGVLGVRLGGPNRYHGKIVEKPFIGKPNETAGPHHIKKACDLMLISSFLWLVVAIVIGTLN